MANDINVNNPALLAGTTSRPLSKQSEEPDAKAAAPAAGSAGADRLSVTSEASRLREIEEHLMEAPEVNATKVAAIRQSIADGTFEINPGRIAEKLLAFEQGNR